MQMGSSPWSHSFGFEFVVVGEIMQVDAVIEMTCSPKPSVVSFLLGGGLGKDFVKKKLSSSASRDLVSCETATSLILASIVISPTSELAHSLGSRRGGAPQHDSDGTVLYAL